MRKTRILLRREESLNQNNQHSHYHTRNQEGVQAARSSSIEMSAMIKIMTTKPNCLFSFSFF